MPEPADLDVALLVDLPPVAVDRLGAAYRLHRVSDAAQAPRARAVITNGKRGIRADEVAALPALAVVVTIGVGYEGVDVDALDWHGVALVTGRGTNEDAVADHALALLLASARRIVDYDAAARRGARPEGAPTSLTGKTLGILGLGEIGRRIAARGEAFRLRIAYHGRTRQPDLLYDYYDTPEALAAASDFLVVSVPGGAATRHLVDRAVLRALGPKGRLINVGRGETVDTEALVAALRGGEIAAAALDVVEGEPASLPTLADVPNLILTPHIASHSPERVVAMTDHLLKTLETRLNPAALTPEGALA